MRRLPLWLLGLFLPLMPLHADTPPATSLPAIMQRLGAHASVRADFVQTRTNPALAQPQVSQGRLLFVLGHGMLWQTEQPIQETLILTGDHVTRLDAQNRPQALGDARGVNQVSQMLQALLAGHADPVLRTFDAHTEGDSADWTVRFTPRQSRVAKVLSTISLRGDDYLEGIRIEMQDGSSTEIRFSHARDAGTLSATEKNALQLP